MTISEILQKVTILSDYTAPNQSALAFITMGAMVAIVFSVLFIHIFRLIFSNGILALVASMVVIGIAGVVIGIFLYIQRPLSIDFYICTNDVAIEQLVEYFDVDELSKVDDSIVCHITPKAEYYDEVLKIRAADKDG